jgi:hypothetical protein
MKKTIYISLMVFLMLLGCTKSVTDIPVTQDENQLKIFNEKSARTATEFNVYENTIVLQTAIFPPLATGAYSYASFAPYDFTPYFINGETVYHSENYDLMTHFQYYSTVPLTNAVVEFTFPHILYFVPHVTNGNKHRVFTTNNLNNETVITTITNFTNGWNPMFCFMVKVDCSKGKSGLATIWSDMKINGVSVKGSIKNKVFACN